MQTQDQAIQSFISPHKIVESSSSSSEEPLVEDEDSEIDIVTQTRLMQERIMKE